MRYAPDHKQQTRERLLKAAASAIRQDGPHNVSVAAVMAKAGLTHGGFYAHFKSREDLIAEGVAQMYREGRSRLRQSLEGRGPAEALADYIGFYLSPAHRDSRTTGCPLPFLAADAPRLAPEIRARFAAGAQALEAELSRVLQGVGCEDAEAEAGSLMAEMVGALSLARAEPDRERADLILARSRERLFRRYGLA